MAPETTHRGRRTRDVVAPEGLAWRKMHPITPLVKGWQIVAAILLVLLLQQGRDIYDLIRASSLPPAIAIIGIFLGVTLIIILISVLVWSRTEFAISPDTVYLRKGVIARSQRSAKLDRIQAIDIVQPLLGRLFGLAELKIDVAGGAMSGVSLAYLKEEEARRLRVELLTASAGLKIAQGQAVPSAVRRELAAQGLLPAGAFGGASDGAPGQPGGQPAVPGGSGAYAAPGVAAAPGAVGAPGTPAPYPGAPATSADMLPQFSEQLEFDRPIYEVPTGLLIRSMFRYLSMWFIALVIVVLIIIAIVAKAPEGLSGIIPSVLVAVSIGWSRFTAGFNFEAGIAPEGIRLRHGLLENRHQTVPPGRIQSVELSQPLLWRGPNWWRIAMNVAGYAMQDISKTATLLPVGGRDTAFKALWLALPDLGTPDPIGVLDAAMRGTGTDKGFTLISPRARWVDPFTWRRTGFIQTERALIIRRGWLTRRVTVVPHEKTQSLSVHQGPVQRAMRVASFRLHSTVGEVAPLVQHLDLEVADALMTSQSARAREARASAGPEQWFAHVAAQVAETAHERAVAEAAARANPDRFRPVSSGSGTLQPRENPPDATAFTQPGAHTSPDPIVPPNPDIWFQPPGVSEPPDLAGDQAGEQ